MFMVRLGPIGYAINTVCNRQSSQAGRVLGAVRIARSVALLLRIAV
jgi:hypothetical protein